MNLVLLCSRPPYNEHVPTERTDCPDAFLLAEHKLAVSAKALVPIYFSAAKALPGQGAALSHACACAYFQDVQETPALGTRVSRVFFSPFFSHSQP